MTCVNKVGGDFIDAAEQFVPFLIFLYLCHLPHSSWAIHAASISSKGMSFSSQNALIFSLPWYSAWFWRFLNGLSFQRIHSAFLRNPPVTSRLSCAWPVLTHLKASSNSSPFRRLTALYHKPIIFSTPFGENRIPKYRGAAFGLIRRLCLFCIFKKNSKIHLPKSQKSSQLVSREKISKSFVQIRKISQVD